MSLAFSGKQRHHFVNCVWVFLAVVFLFGTVGCGGPESLAVRGKVVFADDQPVENGKIEFRGVGSEYRAMGEIAKDGSFSLRTLDGVDGVPAGAYDVIVLQIIITEDLGKAAHDHGRPVPRKYGDYFTSGLKVEVTPENASSIVIKLAE